MICKLIFVFLLCLLVSLLCESSSAAWSNSNQDESPVLVIKENDRKLGVKATKAPKTPPASTKAPTVTKAPTATSTKTTKSSSAVPSWAPSLMPSFAPSLSLAPSNAPSSSPSMCSEHSSATSVMAILAAISDICLMLIPGTPQNLAYTFVTDENYLVEGSSTDAAWHQRFALAVFYYSMDNGSTKLSDWMQEKVAACDWGSAVILCDGDSVIGLNMAFVRLEGTLPSELQGLSELQNLDLIMNSLTGTIPSELANLSDSLTLLKLSANQFTGTIPTELGNLGALTVLSFSDNHLTGALPSELGKLLELRYFYSSNNMHTGTIPTEFGNLVRLVSFGFTNSGLTGTIPTELGNLLSLGGLYFPKNALSGTIPSELGNISGLTDLDLGGGNGAMTTPIPTQICSLPSLNDFFTSFCPNKATCCDGSYF